MIRGTKPKPTKIHLLNGNPSLLNLDNRVEPEPDITIPDCPKHLIPAARREWKRISVELFAIGLISQVDRTALAIYCQAYGRWVEAEKKIKQTGEVIKAPSGYPVLNPYLSIANRAYDIMYRFLVEFGMTPAARVRLAVPGRKKTIDPLEDILAGVN